MEPRGGQRLSIGPTGFAAVDAAAQNTRADALLPGNSATPGMDRLTGGTRKAVGRLGTPEEIAEAVPWTNPGPGAFTTGASTAADGGGSL